MLHKIWTMGIIYRFTKSKQTFSKYSDIVMGICVSVSLVLLHVCPSNPLRFGRCTTPNKQKQSEPHSHVPNFQRSNRDERRMLRFFLLSTLSLNLSRAWKHDQWQARSHFSRCNIEGFFRVLEGSWWNEEKARPFCSRASACTTQNLTFTSSYTRKTLRKINNKKRCPRKM